MKLGRSKTKLSMVLSSLLAVSVFAQDEANKLDDVTVTGGEYSEYFTFDRSSVNRTGIEIEDMSRSVQVFNRDFMNDYQVRKIQDVVTMSSNVAFSGDQDGRGEQFNIRGFDAPILRDGVKASFGHAAPEIYNMEKVEVLKGPDSIQYGQSNPGGLINLVRKKPQMQDHKELVVELSSNPSVGVKADVGGTLSKKHNAAYRVVAVVENEEPYQDFNMNRERYFLAPSLSFSNDNQTFTIFADLLNETIPNEMGSAMTTDGEIINRKLVITHPDDDFDRRQRGFGLEHDMKFKSWATNFKYVKLDNYYDYGAIYMPSSLDSSTGNLTRVFATQKNETEEDIIQFTVNGDLKIGNMRNRLTFGVDYSETDADTSGVWDRTSSYIINVNNPVYESSLPSVADHPSATSYSNPTTTRNKGVFFQDHIDVTDKVITSIGLRHSKVTSTGNKPADATIPQLGVMYKFNPDLSVYANYSESFIPATATTSSGDLLDPETGKGSEIGLKHIYNDSINITLAAFSIEKENIAQTDPDNSLFSVASGKQTSKGLEFDINGEIEDGWSVVAAYGYTKTEDKADNPGKELTTAPRHTAKLFSTYALSGSGEKGFSIGGGFEHLGKRYGNATNTLILPKVTVYNASLAYKAKNWSTNFSIKNLTDESYAVSTWSTSRGIDLGTPRTAYLTTTYKF